MLESLIQWMTEFLAGVLQAITSLYNKGLTISLFDFISTFPIFVQAYEFFRTLGLGLAIVLAITSLYSFFMFRGADRRNWVEPPWQVLVRTAASVAMIYSGGRVLSYFVGVATSIFEVFATMDVTKPLNEIITPDNVQVAYKEIIGADIGALTEGALTLLTLFCIVAIFVNVFKLILEVGERYLMVGVLVYTAPLVFSTYASAKTEGIFKKWLSMFLGSCLILSISSFFTNAVLSGLYSIEADQSFFIRILLCLAMAKIAQRVDNIMQQLGIGVATTGGHLLDDILAGSKMIKGTTNTVKSAAGVLGGIGERSGGLIGGVYNAGKQTVESYSRGENLREMKAAATAGFKDRFRDDMLGGAIVGAVNAKRTGGNVAAGAAAGAASGTVQAASRFVAPNLTAQHNINKQNKGAEIDRANYDAQEATASRYAATGTQPLTQETISDIENGKRMSAQDAAMHYASSGVAVPGQSVFADTDEDGEVEAGYNFLAAGGTVNSEQQVRYDANGNESEFEQEYLTGPDNVMRDAISNELSSPATFVDPIEEAIKQKVADNPETGINGFHNLNNEYRKMVEEDLQDVIDYRMSNPNMPLPQHLEDAAVAKAKEYRDSDIEATEGPSVINDSYRDMLSATIKNTSPAVLQEAFMNPDKPVVDSEFSQQAAERAFSEFIPANSTVVSAESYKLRDSVNPVNGNRVKGGMCVEITTKDDMSGETKTTHLYSDTTGMTQASASKLTESTIGYSNAAVWTDLGDSARRPEFIGGARAARATIPPKKATQKYVNSAGKNPSPSKNNDVHINDVTEKTSLPKKRKK